MRVLVNFCIRELDRIGVRGRRKFCAARPEENGRHAVSMINRAVNMKIAIEDSKECNIPANRDMLKIVSQGRGVDETKSFRFHPFSNRARTKPRIL